ncbi:MAG: N-acetylmuramoyl-L-alanine amidase-like domain-containing protein [Patescibacteria group bacterium]
MKKILSSFVFLIIAITLAYCFPVRESEVILPEEKFKKEISLGNWDIQSLEELIERSKEYNDGDRIDYISKMFLEIPYKADTLNTDKDLSENLVIKLDEMDCSTFLDYVVALSLSNDFSDFYDKLKLIRYENGEVSFIKRNHFFAQWIDNAYNINNISNTFEGFICEQKELNSKEWVEGIAPIDKEICFVPRENLMESYQFLKNGDLIGFYTKNEGLDITHLGIISISEKILLRHASSIKGKVIEESLEEYLKNNGRQGLIIARIKN